MERYGLALSDAELADLDARSALQPAISAFSQGAMRLDGFAGFWVDQAAGGRLVLMTTAAGQAEAQAYLASRPDGTTGRIEVVERTDADLQALVARVTSDWDSLQGQGISITGVGLDVQGNAVEVDVDSPTTTQIANLQSLYGSAVEVRSGSAPKPSSCTSRSNCWDPAKGGLWVHSNSSGDDCSSGFVVADTHVNVYLFTAGHCKTGSYTHNGVSIGTATYTARYQSSPADALIINIADSESSNEYYFYPTNFMHVTARVGTTGDYVGEAICIQSWYYGINCGQITNTNWSATWDGIGWVHQRRGNYHAHSGDSGDGIYLSAHTYAEGMTAAGYSDSDCIFSQIAYAETATNSPYPLLTCTSMAC